MIVLLTTAVGRSPVEGVQAGLHLMLRGVFPEFPHGSSVASAFKSSSVSMAHDTLAVWKSRERRHPARCADGYWSCRNMRDMHVVLGLAKDERREGNGEGIERVKIGEGRERIESQRERCGCVRWVGGRDVRNSECGTVMWNSER